MSESGFDRWFDANSGYAPHRPLRRTRVRACPCGGAPARTSKTVFLPLPSGETPFALFLCPVCGHFFAEEPDGLWPLDSLLRYRVESGN